MPGEMLDQDAGEALHRTANRAVHHDRHFLLAVGIDIKGAEPLGEVEVDLRRAALPLPADRIAQGVFEFRPVESTLARIDAGLDPSPDSAAIFSSNRLNTASA